VGAATIALAIGGLLRLLVHRGTWGTPRHILAIGAFCALIAAGFQGMTGGPAPRKCSVAGEPEASRLCHRVATGQRVVATFSAQESRTF